MNLRKLILLALAATEQFIGHTIDLTGEGASSASM
jgi:hypothetical protein